MNKIIRNGAICLFRRYNGGSRNGKIVLVKLTHLQDPDTGSHYTVKEYQSSKHFSETNEWRHQTITLLPRSTDAGYQPIRLEEDALNQVEVIGIFEAILE